MEIYLSAKEIARCPIGKKYKKSTYGGAKFFIKQKLLNRQNEQVTLEFMLRLGRWQLDKIERQKARRFNIDPLLIRRVVRNLNKNQVKKPVKFPLSKHEYFNLYRNYQDIDQLRYYKSSSPEYIRVEYIVRNIREKSLVYDAGCNSGGIGKILIKTKRCRVFGSEICPELAQSAKDKGMTVFCGWAEKTPFKNNYFDYAILAFVLEHVISPNKLMKETVRLLKPGGEVIGQVPTEFGDWGKRTIGRHPEHLRAYNKQELQDLLKSFGLRLIVIEKRRMIGRRIADHYFFKARK